MQTLPNQVVIAGSVLTTTAGFTPNGQTVTDNSAAAIRTADVTLDKEIYAVNGTACLPQPCANVRVNSGGTVTFRFRFTAPTDNLNGFSITDYLPLPIFNATTVTAFNPIVSAVPPPTGAAKFGPDHSLATSLGPTLTTNSAQNAIVFTFGTIAPTDILTPVVIDLLVTIEASELPFIDGLLFGNFLESRGKNSTGANLIKQDLVQMTLTQPVLSITKTVVAANSAIGIAEPPLQYAFNNTGACPRFGGLIASPVLTTTRNGSNLRNADGGDRVTYAIFVENTGSGITGAFDVRISDTLLANATFVPGSLCITNGAGASLAFTGNLTQGLELVDPPPSGGTQPGALRQGRFANNALHTNGTNILIATYDMILNTGNIAPPVPVSTTLVNTATLINYAAADGGPTFLPNGPIRDTAVITSASPAFSKLLVGSELSGTFNLPNQVAIGELITYAIVITVPEGVLPNVVVSDSLAAGLAYANFITITASPGITRAGGFTGVVTPTVSPINATELSRPVAPLRGTSGHCSTPTTATRLKRPSPLHTPL